ncbi:RNA polymerase sigma factor [Agarilytica rhodophyticola]|uniref:RNA polymerase sigma factor n=1 Tax=Agarilytica rhodophyticola TaxID=1737490 RepID=UPI0013156123|nr:RNA polymerase sigma factor [Agarilytica rhodophyticola]
MTSNTLEKLEQPEKKESIDSVIKNSSVYLRRFISKRAKNKCDIDDFMQATLLEAIRSYHNFRGDSQAKTWLCGIAYNIIRNSIKRQEKDLSVFSEEYSESIDYLSSDNGISSQRVQDPADIIECNELIDNVCDRYEALPEKMQGVFNSLVVEGKSYQDTADQFNVPLGTIRSRMANARKILRQELKA